MKIIRLVVGAVALLFAIVAVLLSHDIRSWHKTLNNATARYAVDPRGAQDSTASTLLPAGVSARLLSVQPDRERASTLRRFALGYHIASTVDPRYLTVPQHRAIDKSMAAVSTATQNTDRKWASQAFDLLALLELSQLKFASTDIDVTAVNSAVVNLQNAIRADDANTAAKVNLELELRSLAGNPLFQGLEPGGGQLATGKQKGARGTPTGTGY